jgi:hypothetical protein
MAAGRPGSKESKLKPPEIIAKRTPITPTGATAKASEPPTRKVPPLPVSDSKQGSFHGVMPTVAHGAGGGGHTLVRADSKSGLSLHRVRSVQSLANEIRRIRSLRTEPDDQKQQPPPPKPARTRQPPPPLHHQPLAQQESAEEKKGVATTSRGAEKKPRYEIPWSGRKNDLGGLLTMIVSQPPLQDQAGDCRAGDD